MKNQLVLVCLLIILLTTACAEKGILIQESRNVSGFTAIVFKTDGALNIIQGGSESLSIQAAGDTLPLIDTEVKDGTLTIQFKDESKNSLLGTHRITYSLTVKDLAALDVDGKGMVNINNLNTERLTVRINGSAIVSASGKAIQQEISIVGMGHYEAPDMASEETKVTDGIGLVTVWVTRRLDVQLHSMGKVYFYGSPEVTQSVSGGGKLISKGDK